MLDLILRFLCNINYFVNNEKVRVLLRLRLIAILLHIINSFYNLCVTHFCFLFKIYVDTVLPRHFDPPRLSFL